MSTEEIVGDEREASPTYSTLQPPQFGQVAKDTLVVRDWFNLAASRLKYQANQTASGHHESLMFGLGWTELEER